MDIVKFFFTNGAYDHSEDRHLYTKEFKYEIIISLLTKNILIFCEAITWADFKCRAIPETDTEAQAS